MDHLVSGDDAHHTYRIPTLVRSGKVTDSRILLKGADTGAVMPGISSFGATGIREDLGAAKHCGDSANYVDLGTTLTSFRMRRVKSVKSCRFTSPEMVLRRGRPHRSSGWDHRHIRIWFVLTRGASGVLWNAVMNVLYE